MIPQQRGPKGYFQGSRKEFLESQLPAYMAVKKGNRHRFWHQFWTAWWERYPWKLDDDAEPPTDPEEIKELMSVGPGEENLKEGVEKRLTNVRQVHWSHRLALIETPAFITVVLEPRDHVKQVQARSCLGPAPSATPSNSEPLPSTAEHRPAIHVGLL